MSQKFLTRELRVKNSKQEEKRVQNLPRDATATACSLVKFLFSEIPLNF